MSLALSVVVLGRRLLARAGQVPRSRPGHTRQPRLHPRPRLPHALREMPLQRHIHVPARVHHLLRPVQVLTPALGAPAGRRVAPDVVDVTDLVGDLDRGSPAGQVRRVLDLQALALVLGQRLVVGDFLHQGAHPAPEALLELLEVWSHTKGLRVERSRK